MGRRRGRSGNATYRALVESRLFGPFVVYAAVGLRDWNVRAVDSGRGGNPASDQFA